MTAAVLVLGLGNPILTDDGVGVAVAESLRAQLPPDADIEVDELSVGGLTLMERVLPYRRVVIVDAMLTGSLQVGAIRRMTLDDLRTLTETRHSVSAHDATLVWALDLARRMGLSLPEEIVIVGIEVQEVLVFGEEATPAVAAAVPQAVEAVRQELRRWGALP